jgi:adenosylhomocysteinase
MTSRIRDIGLANTVTKGELLWWRRLLPVSSEIGDQVSLLDLRGKNVACFQHISMTDALTLGTLLDAGATVRCAAVNPDSTDDRAAALLASRGADVWAWSRMTDTEVEEGLRWLLDDVPDAVSDMGGEFIAGCVERGLRPAAALEATTSGLHRLNGLDVPFPVFNWNDIPLKDRIHNRHHVGLTAWPAFTAVTGMALHGRSVLVVGFGPVGRGVALVARALGAVVSVAELDPVRALEAQHHGCRDVPLEEGLANASIVVTATGIEGVLGPDQLARLRPGTMLANVGHSNREIDVGWLDQQPHDGIVPGIDRYVIDGSDVYLLNRGSLVNLAPQVESVVDEFFDPFAAIIISGLAWILNGGAEGASPGLQQYPAQLEKEIADLVRRARS